MNNYLNMMEAPVSNNIKKPSSSETSYEAMSYICYVCGERYSCNSNLKQHMDIHFKDINFSYLFENLPATNFEASSIAFNGENVSYENNAKPTVESSSTCLDSLLDSKNQQIPPNITISNVKENKKTYECCECHRIFSRNCNLVQHKRSHIKEKTLKCELPTANLATNITALCCEDISCENKDKPTAVSNVESSSTCLDNLHELKNQQIASKTTLPNVKKTYECCECHRIFSRNYDLLRHKRSHMKKTVSCEMCSKVFSSKTLLKRHSLIHNIDENKKYLCEFCNHTFTRKGGLNKHLRKYQSSSYVCTDCNRKFCRRLDMKIHVCKQQTATSEFNDQNPYCEKVKNFKRKNELKLISSTTFENFENSLLDLKRFLNSLTTDVEYEIKYNLYEKKDLKCSFILEAVVYHSNQDELSTLYLHSNTLAIFTESIIRNYIEQVFNEMLEQYFKLKDNWTLRKIIKLEVITVKFN